MKKSLRLTLLSAALLAALISGSASSFRSAYAARENFSGNVTLLESIENEETLAATQADVAIVAIDGQGNTVFGNQKAAFSAAAARTLDELSAKLVFLRPLVAAAGILAGCAWAVEKKKK